MRITNLSWIVALVAFSTAAKADLLVSDDWGSGVLRYDGTTGAYLGVFAATGPNSDFWGDIIPDGHGNILVGSGGNSNPAISRYDPQTAARLNYYSGLPFLAGYLAVGPNGNIFATDFFGDRVGQIDANTGAYLGDFVTGGSGGLDGPTGLTFGPNGDLFVSSRINGLVKEYNGVTGAFIRNFATPGGNGPQDLEFESDGNLYVAVVHGGTRGQIYRYNAQTGAPLGLYATTLGQANDGMSFVLDSLGVMYVSIGYNPPSVEKILPGGVNGGYFVQPGSGGLSFPIGLYFTSPVPEPASLFLVPLLALRRRRPRRCS